MYLKSAPNDYGVDTAHFKCDSCGEAYTITPHPKQEKIDDWQSCMSQTCDSYDPSRDADVLFCNKDELKTKKIIHIDMLNKRKQIKGY